jgi:hypothetical protein
MNKSDDESVLADTNLEIPTKIEVRPTDVAIKIVGKEAAL